MKEFILASPGNLDDGTIHHPYGTTFTFDIFFDALHIDQMRIMNPEEMVTQ